MTGTNQTTGTETTEVNLLDDILRRRGRREVGGLPHRWLELAGGNIVEMTAFEPDPRTFRHEYYYNVILNQLFRRIVTDFRPEVGIIRAYWKVISH